MMNNNISITIFGGTGDLAYRKLLPAIYDLYSRKLLGDSFKIIAIGRRDYHNEDYHQIIIEWIKKFSRTKIDETMIQALFKHIDYYKMDFTNIDEYKLFNHYLKDNNYNNNLIYYAVAPEFFEIISKGIQTIDNIKNPKIILEKPFGASLNEAKKLNKYLDEAFGENNIYRIDHYLGKEMIRNILTIRESNPIFSNVWSNENIESVHISALETVGVETRGNYYDRAGALKDMVQNHLLQILSIVALDNPNNPLPYEQLKVFNALRATDKINIQDTLVIGQYEGYQKEDKVNPDSHTETFAGLKLFIDNPRWQGVPFFIKTGKKCSRREIEVAIVFKKNNNDIPSNILVIKIQPTEAVHLEFNIKTPGEDSITKTHMEFCQNCNLEFKLNTPEAYERMLCACINNDDTWFTKWEQIELSWKYIQELKDLHKNNNLPLYNYKQGEDGPIEFNNLIQNINDK